MFCQDCFCLLSTTKSEDNSTSNSTTSAIKGDDLVNCLFNSHDINNGVCDDFANIEECLFDGGKDSLKIIFAMWHELFQMIVVWKHLNTSKSSALIVSAKKEQIERPQRMPAALVFSEHKVVNKKVISRAKSLFSGDGFCHDELNNDLCDYDGGDCCLNVTMINVCDDCTCKNNVSKVHHSFTNSLNLMCETCSGN